MKYNNDNWGFTLLTQQDPQYVLQYIMQDNNQYFIHKPDSSIIEKFKQAASLSVQSKSLQGTKVFGLETQGIENKFLVVLAPVYITQNKMKATVKSNNNPDGFVGLLIQPGSGIELILNSAQWQNNRYNVALAELLNGENDKWQLLYSNYNAKDAEKAVRDIDGESLKQFYPLFIWGKAYGLFIAPSNTHNSQKGFFNPYLLALFFLIFTIVITLLIRLTRNKWGEMNRVVEHSTDSINILVRELSCLQHINDQMQIEFEKNELLKKIPEIMMNYFVGIQFAVELIYRDKKFSSVMSENQKYSINAALVVKSEAIGKNIVYSTNECDFKHEDQTLIDKVAHSLSRWLEHQLVIEALKESEEKFSYLVENAFDAIYLMEDRHYSYVNKAYETLSGYSVAELTSKDFDFNVLLTAKSLEIAEERYKLRLEGKAVEPRYESQIQSKTGLVKDVEISTVSLGSKGKVIIMGIIRDITDRNKFERELLDREHQLQQQNEELQVLNEELQVSSSHVREMNIELVKAKEKAEASDNLKTAFLNNISHEVRTPLNGIMGATVLISDPEISNDDRAEMAWIIQQSSQRLIRTITEYMDISLLNSENMPIYFEETNVFEMLRPLMDETTVSCIQNQLKFDVQWPENASNLLICTDKNLLEKVINHLMNNAVKFTEKGVVGFKLINRGHEVEFVVSDTGIGIDKNLHHLVFNNFMQEDNSNMRRYDGSGLGLSIAKKITSLLDGRLWFESEKGRGSTFHLCVPIEKITHTSKETDPEEVQTEIITKPLILIAEDEESNFMVLQLLLKKRLNARILRAVNGQEAIECCRKYPNVQLVLMDLKMPVMDGFEATAIIKAEFPELPVIAITAYGLSGDEHRALSAGCNDYIAKPVQVNVLMDKVKCWIK